MKIQSFAAILAAQTILAGSAFGGSALAGELKRVASVPVGAEITGLFLQDDDLFFNIQHPADSLPNQFSKASVGVISNAKFDGDASAVPSADEDKQKVVSALGDYQILFQEGSFGKIGKISGKGGEIKVSNDPDFNAFVPTGDNEGYLFTNWEDRPGGMSRVKIKRGDDGKWMADENDAMMVDFSSVGGTWVNCFGTLSPWGNPLTSEELYYDDTADWNNKDYKYIDGPQALENYLGKYPNPYDYGYIVEIADPKGTPKPVKHYAMGRYSHENAVVMPDNKTVYLSDDGTGTVFFKFVADKAGDLSAGTLYAAKAKQQGEPGSSAASTGFAIEWIELAHASNDEIEKWIRQYDGRTQADYVEGSTNYIPDEEILAWAAGKAKDNRVVFLESRKAAAAKGATAEFRKMEGVNINYEGAKSGKIPYIYMAMSQVSKTMADDKGDIQLEANGCGVVYEMKLDENFNISRMVPVVAGGKKDGNNKPNACPTDKVSNPDNLIVLNDGRVVIGEDTGSHENNMLWVWKR